MSVDPWRAHGEKTAFDLILGQGVFCANYRSIEYFGPGLAKFDADQARNLYRNDRPSPQRSYCSK